MNSKLFILPLIVLYFAVSFSGICSGEDKKTTLTVKKIAFTRDKSGGESISLFCNQSCTPELSFLEGENPRVVMDMKGVSLIQTKTRNVNTRGKLVKSVRSYLDGQTNILRVVLDLQPSKSYIVRPMQNPPENAYVLTIYEDLSLSEEKPGGIGDDKGSPLTQEKQITNLRPDPRPEEQEGNLKEAAQSPENRSDVKATKEAQSVDQGGLQLNAGELAAEIDAFTQITAAHPPDSLIYRLRRNAYDNLVSGRRDKAVEDWIQAARLGDATLQSYLDFLQVKWRENPAPYNIRSVLFDVVLLR